MSVKEWIEEHKEELGKFPSRYARAKCVAECTGCHPRTAEKILARTHEEVPKAKSSKQSPEDLTRDSLRKAVKQLTDDDQILSMYDFLSTLGTYVSAVLTKVRMEPEFRPYQFVAKGHVRWCTPDTKIWALQQSGNIKDI